MRRPLAELAAPGASRAVDVRLVLWMVLLSSLWGLNAITIRAVSVDMPPLLAAGLRGLVALACLVPWGLLRGHRLVFRGMQARHGIAAGLLFGAEFCLFYPGARFTSGGHVAIYMNTAPFFVAVGAHYLLVGERMTPRRWLGLVLAFTGIVVLFSDELLVRQSGYWKGDLLVIAGAVAWALTTLYIKRFMVQNMNGFELLYVQIGVSTPLLLALGLLPGPAVLGQITALGAAIVLFQGTVIVFFSYLAWMTVLRIYPASAAQSFTFLTPVWGVALGALVLDERVTAGTFVAIALVGVGLWLVNRPRRPA